MLVTMELMIDHQRAITEAVDPQGLSNFITDGVV